MTKLEKLEIEIDLLNNLAGAMDYHIGIEENDGKRVGMSRMACVVYSKLLKRIHERDDLRKTELRAERVKHLFEEMEKWA